MCLATSVSVAARPTLRCITCMISRLAQADIIVPNSILLIDFIELQVAQGMSLLEAVISSATVRVQPNVVTGLSAIKGAAFILPDPIFNGLVVCTLLVNVWWLVFTALIGANLLQFGFTNICPLGWLLRKAGVPERCDA